jgi:Phosphoglycerol transferase and related proteins, alkaline phosphatase superfamily
VTFYSEDNPSSEAFTLRLRGFDALPTDRYLRSFWNGAKNFRNRLNKNSPACLHKFEIRLLRRVLKNYADMPSFSLYALALAHDTYQNTKLVDEDFYNFHQWLDESSIRRNTLTVYFGDHGPRSSAFRKTMTGKLEERLPFLAFSFPRWFKDKYPREFRNFQNNADVITTYYDIHVTLRHLMEFSKSFHNTHKWGKSLFTDLIQLNRTCSDAGIMDHWCPCIEYKPLDETSPLARKLSLKFVSSMNTKLKAVQKADQMCERLGLLKVIRIQKIQTNDKVRQFVNSFRKGCDGCGVRLNDNRTYTSDSYEIVISTSPNQGLYETTLVQDRASGQVKFTGEISRINKYAEQPHCIAEDYPHLRKYCFCKRQLS